MLTPSSAAAAPRSELPPGMKPAGMSVAAACEYFDCAKPKIYEWISAGLLERFYVGSQVRITVASVEHLYRKLLEDARHRPTKSKYMRELRKRRDLRKAAK